MKTPAKVAWEDCRSPQGRVWRYQSNPLGMLVAILIGLIMMEVSTAQGADVLIPVNAQWRYLDTGTDAGTVWRQTNFNDSTWSVGTAQLGYGDGDETTVVNSGPSGTRYATTYFRNTFVVTNRASISNVALRLLRDDGGIVYLNGVEVFRSNMPDAPAAYNTWAAVSVSAPEENAYFAKAVPPGLLVAGTNVVAVEVHQIDGGSSDMSFGFELLANSSLGNLPPVVSVTGLPSPPIVSTGQVVTASIAATDPETALSRLEVYYDGLSRQVNLTNSATFTWSNSVPGIHDLMVRAQDAAGVYGTSVTARVLVTPPGFQASSVFYPQFASTAGLILHESASVSSNWLHLNQTYNGARGAAWLATKQNVLEGFTSEFRFRMVSRSGGGADGFAFIIAGVSQPGLDGGAIGYSGITNSLAVEFDTWLNSGDLDPSDYHISLHSRGLQGNTGAEGASLGVYSAPTDFSDGNIHTVRIEYVPGRLRIYYDNLTMPVLNLTINLSTLLSLPNGNAWIGFTGGTGGSYESHDIMTWSYTSYGNVPPTISLLSPASATRVEPGKSMTLTALASDANGPVVSVDFYDGVILLGRVTNAPYNLAWTPTRGIHNITARTSDPEGLRAASATVVVEAIPSAAKVEMFPEFPDARGLTLQDTATITAGRLRLNPAAATQKGGAWLASRQIVEQGFESVFQFQITGQSGSSGADGLAFVILGAGAPVLGDGGAGMCYSSLYNSLAVEFDTYQNTEAVDLDGNHIGIHSRGTGRNSTDESASLARVTPAIKMSDGQVHTVVIRYVAGRFMVFLDDLSEPALTLAVDLKTLLNLDLGSAWVGLTAATGGSYEAHDILMWSFRPNALPQVTVDVPGLGPFLFPTNILLSVDAADTDGEIARVEFFAGGTFIGRSEKLPFVFLWNNPAAGTYSLTARAIDDLGATATSTVLPFSILHVPQVSPGSIGWNGRPGFNFATVTGLTYTVQYSADLVHWSNAIPSIRAAGATLRWEDMGLPGTESDPATQPQRFYRVVVAPE